jgi:hypothetical protein
MVIDPCPGVAGAGVNFIRSIQTNVFFWKIGVACPRRTRSSLAVEAMADVDHSRLARDDDAKLTTKAFRGSLHDSFPGFLIHAMGFIRSPGRRPQRPAACNANSLTSPLGRPPRIRKPRISMRSVTAQARHLEDVLGGCRNEIFGGSSYCQRI